MAITYVVPQTMPSLSLLLVSWVSPTVLQCYILEQLEKGFCINSLIMVTFETSCLKQ